MNLAIFKRSRLRLLLVGAACICHAFFSLCPTAKALDPNKHISQYAHTSWYLRDGYFSGAPKAIVQTVDGYIWIGTKAGLFRFDGVRFTQWSPPDGEQLPSNDVLSLLAARDGTLWIGTTGGLGHWKNGKLTNYTDTLGTIDSIVETRGGTVWVGLSALLAPSANLCQVIGSGLRCDKRVDAVPNAASTQAVIEDSDANLWTGTDISLIRWTSGVPTEYSLTGLKSNGGMLGVSSIAPRSDGSLWVGIALAGAGLGLEQFTNGVWKPFVTRELDGRTLLVNALYLDREGALWVGTNNEGVYRIFHDHVAHFTSKEGLSGDSVFSFCEDREGNLWIVTSKGIDNLRDTHVVTYTTSDGLGTEEVDSVIASRNGTIWIGGANSLDAIRNNVVSSIHAGKGLPGSQVTSLFEDHAGRLWVGIDHTLTIYQNGTFKRINKPDGSPIGLVVGICEDIDDNLWAEITGSPRTLFRIHDLKVRGELPTPQMPAARRIAPDLSEGIWLGLINGDLARYRRGKTEVFHFGHAGVRGIQQIAVNSDGTVLAASALGLLGLKNGKQQTLTTENGLPCEGAYSFVFDHSGALWVTTQCGLVEFTRGDLQTWWEHPAAKLSPTVFGPSDGFQSGYAPFAAAARSTDGRLWFANGLTLQMVDPEHLQRNSTEPPVHIEEIIADRRTYPFQKTIRLEPFIRDLDIRYTALSFINPRKVQFRYVLQGQDTGWRDAGTRREAFYTNLSPGHYRFRVIACNNDGVWNEIGAELNFIIPPAFYQTAWFKILLAAIATLALWSLYLFRLKQATARIQERLNERIGERERIARELHDTLLQGFQGLMLRFQAVMEGIPEHQSARENMEKVLERADEVLFEGRERVSKLRAETKSGEDLPQAVALCGEDLAQNHTAQFAMAVVGTPQPLNAVVLDEAYRIGREALVNAFAHSNALRIEVELTYDLTRVRLSIRDNGDGIDLEILKSGRSGHWGLSGMRERAQNIGGHLNVWSHHDAGSEIELIIPAKLAYRRSAKRLRWKWIRRAVRGRI